MPARRWLITGANGQLGAYLLDALRGERVTAWAGTRALDLTDRDAVAAAWRAVDPDVVVHAAALARVEDCRRDPALARRINVQATAHLAELAEVRRARFVYVSTDLVFDGERAPYREDDTVSPLSVYGRTKADAEAAVANGVVARVSLLVGPSKNGRPNFWDHLADALRAGRPATLFADEWRTPLGYATAARALVALGRADATGVFHVGGPERLSRVEMGRRLAAALGVSAASIVEASRNAGATEPRPRDVSLDSAKFRAAFPDPTDTGLPAPHHLS